MLIKPITKINRIINVIGDKSMTHRSLMLSAISNGKCTITNAGICEDIISTINCLTKLGASFYIEGTTITVTPISKPNDNVILDCRNSGTTARLLSGIVCGLGINAKFTGDESLSKRPMRMIEPLRKMNAEISLAKDCLFEIKPSKLKAITYIMPIPSAQLKSCILLAGLFADGTTQVIERSISRNHTELMLEEFDADINVNELIPDTNCGVSNINDTYAKQIFVKRCSLNACNITIGADISQASYFIALAAMLVSGEVNLNNVNINSTRAGLLQLLINNGLNCRITNKRKISNEMTADLIIRSSRLSPLNIPADIIPTLIDEIPLAAILAAKITGKSIFKGIGELRYKESDRINSTCKMLEGINCKYLLSGDDLVIYGEGKISGGKICAYSDHRIAMSGVIAGLVSINGIDVDDVDCISVSYPDFISEVNML